MTRVGPWAPRRTRGTEAEALALTAAASPGRRDGGGLAVGRAAVPTFPGGHRMVLAVHEASHAVVGVIHGAIVESSVVDAKGQKGLTSFSAASFEAAGPAVYRSHIAAAGAVGEALFLHGRRPSFRDVEARLTGSDKAELEVEAMRSLRPVVIPVAPVERLLTRNWGAVAVLAAEIYAGRPVGHREVCAALGLGDQGGPHSVELAVLRSA